MVCLKDFKMPKTCEECTLESYCSLWVDARRLSDDGKKAKIRHPDCPLIPVPEHGRLIDADALTNRIGSYMPIKWTYEYGSVVSLNDIEYAPTIFPADDPK